MLNSALAPAEEDIDDDVEVVVVAIIAAAAALDFINFSVSVAILRTETMRWS